LSALEAVEINCPNCKSGCDDCRGKGSIPGRVEITGCPREQILPGTRRLVQIIRSKRHGLLPVSGGLLDQSAFFLNVSEFVIAEEDMIRAQLKLDPLHG
jgi:hypothetical protein